MSVISGSVIFFSTGPVAVNFGSIVNGLDVLAGYTGGVKSIGHADAGNQFCFNTFTTGGVDTTHAIAIYNSSNVKMVEASVTSGWGTSILMFNVTAFNTSFPWLAIARS